MLDTVLNLGLNDESVEGLARADRATSASPGTPTGASCRCSATSAAASPGERFEEAIKERQGGRAASSDDTELDADALKALTDQFKDALPGAHGEDFPQDPQEQLRQAIRAVFDSWTGERAVDYRRINRIPDDWGTAVNVQQMVFGNKGDTSGSGVAFSPRRGHRRARAERRLPAQRPGRGRRLRRAHAARPRRA